MTLTNLFTSIFAGFVIFSIIGYLAHQTNLPIEETVRSGPGLAFVAYPEAVVRMPLPNMWAVLFFLMLFILGLGSQVNMIQYFIQRCNNISNYFPYDNNIECFQFSVFSSS